MTTTAVDSLLRERAGYLARGLVNRVAQVDAELERHGHKPEAVVERATVAATDTPEVPRTRKPRK